MDRKTELIEQIKKYADAYYEGQELISDKEYDALIEELRILDPNNELIAGMAGDETNNAGYPKMQHRLTTGTLNKAMELEVFEKWTQSHSGPYHCTEKLDGAGAELIYENGKLTHLISRGDGFTGFDKITLAQYLNIPKELPGFEQTISIRGEFELSNSSFKSHEIFRDKKNPRNAGSGLLNLKVSDLTEAQIEALKELQFFAYDLLLDSINKKDKKSTIFTLLTSLGFQTPRSRVCNNYDEVIQFREELAKTRDTEDEEFAIDGVVVFEDKLDPEDQLKKIQTKAIAIKFDLMIAVSKLIDIDWSLSGSILTPVGIIEPVQLNGVTVSRANLCNLKIINELGVQIGDKVAIMRRGEVIPKIMYKVV